MNINKKSPTARRDGVVVVMFAIVLPVLLVLAAVAINVAYMQLTRTELKIATDASARAGGRAWSEYNDLGQSKEHARLAASLNTVGGKALVLSTAESDGQIVFGDSIRSGDARFGFTPMSESEIMDGALASGIQVNATHPTFLFFKVGETNSFTPNASSIATQIERDIALILDRSGSMFSFEGQVTDPGKGEDFLYETITDLYNDPANEITHDEYLAAIADYQENEESEALSTRDREYSPKIISLLTGDLLTYATSVNSDYHPGTAAPKLSRWHSLEIAYDAFFDVLEETHQEELVSVSSFASSARLDFALSDDLDGARLIASEIYPLASTAIGDGMLEGFESLKVDTARLGAVKTIIVMSDGLNKKGTDPVAAANQIIAENQSVVINTVTFGAGADINQMAEIARIGSGKHFHATNAAQLTDVFEVLAASHRTLITD